MMRLEIALSDYLRKAAKSKETLIFEDVKLHGKVYSQVLKIQKYKINATLKFEL
jgi:hypothetical protein